MTKFEPNYSVTNRLLSNIKEIGCLTGELNTKVFATSVLIKLEKDARALSTFSSTSIEGNPLPLTDVKRILKSKPENIRDSEREVLNYNKALAFLDKKIDQEKQLVLCNDLIWDIQQMVVKGLQPIRDRGYRKEAVVVNNPKEGKVVYLPPDFQDVEVLMGELIEYVNKNIGKVDPLILAGVFHKQFVIIHPFVDGNGRTTRLITKSILANMGLNTFHLFSFENYYNNNLTRYFQNVGVLGNYYDIKKEFDFTNWLEFFTEGIIDELNRVKKTLPANQPRSEDHHKKILRYIEKNGSITSREYAKITDRKRATRIVDFKYLVDQGLIKKMGEKKSSYYILKND